MCGELVAVAYRQCPACGEPLLPPLPVVNRRDQGLALGIGGLSTAITGYFVWQAIDALAWMNHPLRGPHAEMHRDIALFTAAFVTLWLWGLPIVAVLVGDPRALKKGIVVSGWRLFWQTQGIMYAISVAFVLLCLVTCATR